jgi:hypothetical protein
MSAIFPSVRVGDALRYEQLSVFPLFAVVSTPVEYILAADAIADGTLVVEEVSEAGSVPTLSVWNQTAFLVLFLEGEQLIGAKQNRILNASILIGSQKKTTIPVSCVEQGRWRFKTMRFDSSGAYSPSKLRYALKMSVTGSLQKGQGHRSDQSRVWSEVATLQRTHGGLSPTMAMEDTFDSSRDKLAELQTRFRYVAGSSGVAIALGKQIVCLDLFDKPSTCQKVWDRLLSGGLLEALFAKSSDHQAEISDVERFIADLGAAPWAVATPAGEGQEFRSATRQGTQASALCFAEQIVHGSAVAAAPDES